MRHLARAGVAAESCRDEKYTLSTAEPHTSADAAVYGLPFAPTETSLNKAQGAGALSTLSEAWTAEGPAIALLATELSPASEPEALPDVAHAAALRLVLGLEIQHLDQRGVAVNETANAHDPERVRRIGVILAT